MSPITRRWQRDLNLQQQRPTEVTVIDGKSVPVNIADDRNDILWAQLRKSVRETAKKRETA